jgi:hypothetical protein
VSNERKLTVAAARFKARETPTFDSSGRQEVVAKDRCEIRRFSEEPWHDPCFGQKAV